jgi:hypothetical protein
MPLLVYGKLKVGLNQRLDAWSGGRGSAIKVYSDENDTDGEAEWYLKHLSPS